MTLDPPDLELIARAKKTADSLYVRDRHEVAAALRTSSGQVFSAIHIEASEGFADVCGEVAALSCMVAAGSRELDTIVALWSDGRGGYRLLSPCGRCRELIHDFNPEAWVIVGALGREQKVRIKDLLPLKREKTG